MAQDSIPTMDALIVGGGFGGCYLLRNLRKLGYKVKMFEAGDGLGGVWWWNSYPGARVDTSNPFYEFSDKEVWDDWIWKEAFPGQKELSEYFKHVDKKWDLSKDIKFKTLVTAAEFDVNQDQWTIHTDQGDEVKARYLLLCTGFAAKLYVPQIHGLETFQGTCYHTSRWPKEGVDVEGKRVGVIGTGASGVQVIQEIGPVVEQLTVFQRTPNMSLPMGQMQLERESQQQNKRKYPDLFNVMKETYAGWDYNQYPKNGLDQSPEARKEFWEGLWAKGGFNPWLGNYSDLLTSQEVNDLMYNFWCEKVRARITKDDPDLIEGLAPLRPPHPFGTKRPSLEQSYYEVYNQENVELVNLKTSPIVEVTSTGVKTAKNEYPLDVLVLATGFDAVTGGLTRIDIRGVDGVSLKEKWKTGTKTQLGMSSASFPNMFYMYGPQSPCAFAIGPTISEIQGDWIIRTLEDMKKQNKTRIEALPEAEAIWTKANNDMANATLLIKTDSWYMGANIEGKFRESLNYIGGIPAYRKAIDASAENGYAGFQLSTVAE